MSAGLPSVIVYEYPFNEKVRTYLRIEHLLSRLTELLTRSQALDHHFAIQTLFEIVEVASRSDMKTELLKDLERHRQVLNGYRGNPAISEAALDQFVADLDARFSALRELPGKIGQALNDNEWLASIRSRIAIPGGTCAFDLPAYHDWQQRPAAERQAALTGWVRELAPLSQAVSLLLRLTRDSGATQKVVATGGQWQQNLPQGRTFQLLRLALADASGLVPEISGNRLLCAVRLMEWAPDGKLQRHTASDPVLEVALCT